MVKREDDNRTKQESDHDHPRRGGNSRRHDDARCPADHFRRSRPRIATGVAGFSRTAWRPALHRPALSAGLCARDLCDVEPAASAAALPPRGRAVDRGTGGGVRLLRDRAPGGGRARCVVVAFPRSVERSRADADRGADLRIGAAVPRLAADRLCDLRIDARDRWRAQYRRFLRAAVLDERGVDDDHPGQPSRARLRDRDARLRTGVVSDGGRPAGRCGNRGRDIDQGRARQSAPGDRLGAARRRGYWCSARCRSGWAWRSCCRGSAMPHGISTRCWWCAERARQRTPASARRRR